MINNSGVCVPMRAAPLGSSVGGRYVRVPDWYKLAQRRLCHQNDRSTKFRLECALGVPHTSGINGTCQYPATGNISTLHFEQFSERGLEWNFDHRKGDGSSGSWPAHAQTFLRNRVRKFKMPEGEMEELKALADQAATLCAEMGHPLQHMVVVEYMCSVNMPCTALNSGNGGTTPPATQWHTARVAD
uniref:Uncharacterized protein n=1 Tax=Globodera rostochiensis TaxID=31243 RepID=A0A914GRH7_GLORO